MEKNYLIFKELLSFDKDQKCTGIKYVFVEFFKGTYKQCNQKCKSLEKKEFISVSYPKTNITYEFSEEEDYLEYLEKEGFTVVKPDRLQKAFNLFGVNTKEELIELLK